VQHPTDVIKPVQMEPQGVTPKEEPVVKTQTEIGGLSERFGKFAKEEKGKEQIGKVKSVVEGFAEGLIEGSADRKAMDEANSKIDSMISKYQKRLQSIAVKGNKKQIGATNSTIELLKKLRDEKVSLEEKERYIKTAINEKLIKSEVGQKLIGTLPKSKGLNEGLLKYKSYVEKMEKQQGTNKKYSKILDSYKATFPQFQQLAQYDGKFPGDKKKLDKILLTVETMLRGIKNIDYSVGTEIEKLIKLKELKKSVSSS